ncbi:MAG: hypothetical protein FWC76_04015 [Defluviitaleaceae bacterium]|nr:hypothetical protein [Defluviitaleaceae bacterium]
MKKPKYNRLNGVANGKTKPCDEALAKKAPKTNIYENSDSNFFRHGLDIEKFGKNEIVHCRHEKNIECHNYNPFAK